MAIPSYSSVLAELGISPEELEAKPPGHIAGSSAAIMPKQGDNTALTQVARAIDNLKIIPGANTGEDARVRRMQAEFDREKEQAEFDQTAEGQAQQEYEQSLADEGMRNYAPRDELSQDQRRLLMDEQAAARQAALARRLGIKLGRQKELSLPPDMQIAPTPSAPDPSIPAIGTPTGGEMLESGIKAAPVVARAVPEAVGEVLRENPELVAEIVNPVVGAAGARRDVINMADEARRTGEAANPAEMILTAASAIPIVGKGGKAVGKVGKKVAEKTMKELAEDAAAKAVRGTDEAVEDVKDLSKVGDDAPVGEADELLEESVDEAPLEKGIDDDRRTKEASVQKNVYGVGDDAVRRQEFQANLQRTQREHKYGAAVDDKGEPFYLDTSNKLFMSDDGSAGVAVTASGDLVSVYKLPGSTADIGPILREAKGLSRTTDAYDINGVLPNLYRNDDFVPVARVPFNRDYAPDGWDFGVMQDAAGNDPEVVLMVRDPKGLLGTAKGNYNDIRDSIPVVEDYGAAVKMQEDLSNKVARSVSVFDTPPHSSTFDEYISQFITEGEELSEAAILRHQQMHRNYVDRALAMDIPVPPRVLDEYPGILEGRQPGNPELMASPKEDILENAERVGLIAMGEGRTLPRPKVLDKDGKVVKHKKGKKKDQDKDRKLLNADIGEFLDADHARRMELTGEKARVLDPTNPKDMSFMIKEGAREAAYQLKSAERTGREWYDKVMTRAFELGAVAFPELAEMEEQRVILTALAAITSPQTKAAPNFERALQLYEQLFPRKPGTRKPDFDNLGRMHGYRPDVPLDPKTGKGKLYGLPGVRDQIVYLQSLIDDHGVEGTARRLLTPESYRGMEADLTQRAIKGKGTKVSRPIGAKLDDYELTAASFGPKVGPFFMNLNGLYEVTADMWLSRTYNRLRGDMFTTKKGKRVLSDAPRSASERGHMKEFIRGVAEELGTTEQQAQAILWFYEQRLFSQLGVPAASTAFDEGAELFLKSRGFDFDI